MAWLNAEVFGQVKKYIKETYNFHIRTIFNSSYMVFFLYLLGSKGTQKTFLLKGLSCRTTFLQLHHSMPLYAFDTKTAQPFASVKTIRLHRPCM
jgi:hypothetical protein